MVRSSDETCWAVFSMITIVAQHSAGMPQTDFSHCTGDGTCCSAIAAHQAVFVRPVAYAHFYIECTS